MKEPFVDGVSTTVVLAAIPTEDTNGNYWGQLWFSNNCEPFVGDWEAPKLSDD